MANLIHLNRYHPPWSNPYLIKKKSWQARNKAIIEEEARLIKIEETIKEMLDLTYERTHNEQLVLELKEKLTA